MDLIGRAWLRTKSSGRENMTPLLFHELVLCRYYGRAAVSCILKHRNNWANVARILHVE